MKDEKEIYAETTGVYTHGVSADGMLTEDAQIFGQEHGDVRVRALWVAWSRYHRRLAAHADDMATLRRILGVS